MYRLLKVGVAALVFSFSTACLADHFELSLTNGSAMPISAGAVYTTFGQEPLDQIGNAPSQGLITLCQTGNPDQKISELGSNTNVKDIVKTPGPILPGQSAKVDINISNSNVESLHFVAMYGKTKDLCSTINIDSSELRHVALNAGYEKLGADSIIAAGAASQPTVPTDPNVCQNAADSISCIRVLAQPVSSGAQIHAFGGYLPSLVTFLEGRYGSTDVLSLLLPSSGAVTYKLSVK